MSADVYYLPDISHWTIPEGGFDLFLDSSGGGAEEHGVGLKSAAWTV